MDRDTANDNPGMDKGLLQKTYSLGRLYRVATELARRVRRQRLMAAETRPVFRAESKACGIAQAQGGKKLLCRPSRASVFRLIVLLVVLDEKRQICYDLLGLSRDFLGPAKGQNTTFDVHLGWVHIGDRIPTRLVDGNSLQAVSFAPNYIAVCCGSIAFWNLAVDFFACEPHCLSRAQIQPQPSFGSQSCGCSGSTSRGVRRSPGTLVRNTVS
jgi:hypothetical protein